jgi:hypothetical protein
MYGGECCIRCTGNSIPVNSDWDLFLYECALARRFRISYPVRHLKAAVTNTVTGLTALRLCTPEGKERRTS